MGNNLYVDMENIKRQIRGILKSDKVEKINKDDISMLLISINEKMDIIINLMKQFNGIPYVAQQEVVDLQTSEKEKYPYNIEDKEYIPEIKTSNVVSNVKSEKRTTEGNIDESLDAFDVLD